MKTNTENSCTIEKELSKEELPYIMEKQKEAFEKLKVLESIINNSPFIALSRDASKDFSVLFISENISQFGYKTGISFVKWRTMISYSQRNANM
jgi:hypothetical protein